MPSLLKARTTRPAGALFITVLLLLVVFSTTPGSAQAGGYDVIACNPTVAGGANHSWAPLADGGMTAYTDCPSGQGIIARNVSVFEFTGSDRQTAHHQLPPATGRHDAPTA